MLASANTLLMVAAVSGASIIVSDKALRSKVPGRRVLSMGLLYWLSFQIYLLLPTALKLATSYSFIEQVESLHRYVLAEQATALCIGVASFTLAFIIGRLLWVPLIGRRVSVFSASMLSRKMPYRTLLLQTVLTGSWLVCYSILSAIFDLHDRYSAHAWTSMPARIIGWFPVYLGLVGPYYYLTAKCVRSSNYWKHLESMKLKDSIKSLKGLEIVLLVEASGILLCLIKTGSRSYLVASLLSGLFGWLSAKRMSPKSLFKQLIILFIVVAIGIPAAETLRIARSRPSFYKFNPLSFARQIAADATIKPDLRRFTIMNRRDELSEGVFLSNEICSSHTKSLTNPIVYPLIESCINHGEDNISTKYYDQSLAALKEFPKSSLSFLFETDERHVLLAKRMGLNTKGVSRGERINLLADLYNRFRLSGVLIGFAVLGIAISLLEAILEKIGQGLEKTLLLYLLPLCWLMSNQGFPIITQIWSFAVLWPKIIILSLLISYVDRRIIRYVDSARPEELKVYDSDNSALVQVV